MIGPTDEQQTAVGAFLTGAAVGVQALAGTGKTTVLKMMARSTRSSGRYVAFNRALREDEPVATPDGWRPIGNLRVGDAVLGIDGRSHSVVKVIDRGRRPLYRVSTADGAFVVADGEHLWAIERTHSGNTSYVIAEIATTDEIADHLRRRRLVRLPLPAPLELPERDLSVDPWLLGVLLGDGGLLHGRVWITTSSSHVAQRAGQVVAPFGLTVKIVGSTGGCSAPTYALSAAVRGHGNPLLNALRTLGVYGDRPADKSVPEPYLWSSRRQRLALLQGLMDSDGCAGAGGGVTPIFTSTSEALIEAIVHLARSLGGAASARKMRGGTPKWATAYQATVRLPAGDAVFTRPDRLSRVRARTHDRLLRRRIISVEAVEPGRAVCIAVDAPSSLFLTAGLIPTHNSIVLDAQQRMPMNVIASTVHSLAFAEAGRPFRHRLDGARVKSWELARLLDVHPVHVTTPHLPHPSRVLGAPFLASLVLRTLRVFCQTDDPEPGPRHVPTVEGIDPPGTGRGPNNRHLADHLADTITEAWADWCDPDGQLPYDHGCQPPGTLVRRVVRYGGGVAGPGVYEDVPIETVRVGDRVVSLTLNQRRGYVRRAGRLVTAAGQRDYDAEMVTVTTTRGRRSSYTLEHRCVVRLDGPLAEGNHVVYLARRGEDYRIGRTTWRTRSQNNSLGIRRRILGQRADAVWILSVHATDRDAALAEALAAHRHHLPTWQFRAPNETMPLDEFWAKVGNNGPNAQACLLAHGRDIRFPLWERGDVWHHNTRRPCAIRAVNLLDGMLVLEPDEIAPCAKGELHCYDGSGGWASISIRRGWYTGSVYNLDVEVDHSYVGDGIATHNSYLKNFQLLKGRVGADFLLVDEAQDLSRVMLGIVANQDCQVCLVGDSRQSVYGFTGAVDALAVYPLDEVCLLTGSFRFGAPIADVANLVLAELGETIRVRPNPVQASTVGPVADPDAVLCRTNAAAVRTVLGLQERGRRPHLVGGARDVVAYARAAIDLQNGRRTTHPQLACFDDWREVQAYVSDDPSGGDLALMVKMLDEFGPQIVMDALSGMPAEEAADLVVGTAHAVKGREWARVRLAGDFPPLEDTTPEGFRLLYVGVTRAREALDVSACEPLRELLGVLPGARVDA